MFTETAQGLLARLGIRDWDCLLIGDGSGSMWGNPVGWACVALERTAFARRLFYGAMNDGTVNVAELMAYLAPLNWYTGMVNKAEGKAGNRGRAVYHVHVVTDSEYVVKLMSEGGDQPTANVMFWAAFSLLRRQGFQLNWHFLPRDDVALNRFADALSKAARIHLKQGDLSMQVVEKTGLNPDKLNPWE